jgi:YHS domain-containing protein/uncharacterized protein YuzB (UPF0349 family)
MSQAHYSRVSGRALFGSRIRAKLIWVAALVSLGCSSTPVGQDVILAYPLDHCLVSGQSLYALGDPHMYVYEGQRFWFCCPACLEEFKLNPARYGALLAENVRDRRAAIARESDSRPSTTPTSDGTAGDIAGVDAHESLTRSMARVVGVKGVPVAEPSPILLSESVAALLNGPDSDDWMRDLNWLRDQASLDFDDWNAFGIRQAYAVLLTGLPAEQAYALAPTFQLWASFEETSFEGGPPPFPRVKAIVAPLDEDAWKASSGTSGMRHGRARVVSIPTEQAGLVNTAEVGVITYCDVLTDERYWIVANNTLIGASVVDILKNNFVKALREVGYQRGPLSRQFHNYRSE